MVPVLALSIAFPEGGSEPFAFSALWPIVPIAVIALITAPRREWVLRTGIVLYVVGCVIAFLVTSPVGSNADRLAVLMAGPVAALLWWRRRVAWLALAALPLLYIQWHAPVRDVTTASGDPSSDPAYWQPLLRFLTRQGGPPFRVEIPFSQFHFEAYEVAPRFPSPRGWERQLDIKYNPLFYRGPLTPASYEAWLHRLAVRFVAVSDANLDYAGRAENALVGRGLPYLRLVLRGRHWRVYAVRDPTPIAQGPATLEAIGPDSVTLRARRAGRVLLRTHFTPYWALGAGSGCVEPAGDFTALTLRSAGTVHLTISFSPGRVGARSRRCR
jgi:hypothetical protein